MQDLSGFIEHALSRRTAGNPSQSCSQQELLAGLGTAAPMKSDDLGILPACEFVMSRAEDVSIDSVRLERLADDWVQHPFQVPGWDWEIHWRGSPEQMATYILVLDALNFCFWVDPGQTRWRVFHRQRWYNGYKALAVALGRALEEGRPLTQADYLAEMSLAEMAHILRGEGQIPMLDRRVEHAREVGRQLKALYEGDFTRAIKSAGGSAPALAALIARDFPCFYDVSHYQGQLVPLYKRAQITVVDLAGSLNFEGLGAFQDLDRLTAFADYKIPQVLRALGVLVYSPSLAARVDHQQLLEPGCSQEVEIRAGMVWAVELIRRHLALQGRCLKAYELDWFLWNLGQAPVAEEKPYHRVRTVFY